jgi:hypothetical protein
MGQRPPPPGETEVNQKEKTGTRCGQSRGQAGMPGPDGTTTEEIPPTRKSGGGVLAYCDIDHPRQAMISAAAVTRVKREELEDDAARAEALKSVIDAKTTVLSFSRSLTSLSLTQGKFSHPPSSLRLTWG